MIYKIIDYLILAFLFWLLFTLSDGFQKTYALIGIWGMFTCMKIDDLKKKGSQ